jgi:hypothetical protein
MSSMRFRQFRITFKHFDEFLSIQKIIFGGNMKLLIEILLNIIKNLFNKFKLKEIY